MVNVQEEEDGAPAKLPIALYYLEAFDLAAQALAVGGDRQAIQGSSGADGGRGGGGRDEREARGEGAGVVDARVFRVGVGGVAAEVEVARVAERVVLAARRAVAARGRGRAQRPAALPPQAPQ